MNMDTENIHFDNFLQNRTLLTFELNIDGKRIQHDVVQVIQL